MTPLRCQFGLNGLNFITGAVQTAFGAFYGVYLTQIGWSQADIGFVLSVGTAAGLVFQLPAGVIVDTIHFKRFSIAIALVLLAISALAIIAAPSRVEMITARTLHAFASCLLAPAIAALTLNVCGHDAFSERLGSNGRYASIGNAFGAAVLGAVAYYASDGAVFLVAAVLVVPGLLLLLTFRDSDRVQDDHTALLRPRDRKQREHRPWHIFRDPPLHVFAVAVALFQLANAAMLPLALNELSRRTGQSGFIVSAAIVVPQLVIAICSPWIGRLAQSIGRRPILLIGFASLPLRGLLFATAPDAVPLVIMQLLEGVSGTVLGLMIPLIAADLTRQNGYLNLAIGSLGLAGGVGATASTAVAGWLADRFGASVAFVGLALAGLAALALIWRLMPETRPGKPMAGTPAMLAA